MLGEFSSMIHVSIVHLEKPCCGLAKLLYWLEPPKVGMMEEKENVPWELFPHIRVLPSAQEWLQLQANRQLSPRTVEAYGRSLEDLLRFCEWQEPPLSIEAATKADLGLYVKDLVTRPNSHGQQIIHLHSGSGFSDQTIQLRLTAARLYYDHLIETGKRSRNPVGRGKYTRRNGFTVVRHPLSADERPLVRRKPARQPWIPNDDQFKLLLSALAPESLRNQALFLLMYDGALRREEVVLLEITDIDWAHREVTLRPEICKNSSGRLVLFTQATGLRLRAYLEYRRQIRPGFGRLFLSESDRNRASGITPEMINKIMRAIALRARTSSISSAYASPFALNSYGAQRDIRAHHCRIRWTYVSRHDASLHSYEWP
jgi:integrase/recombinase XerD